MIDPLPKKEICVFTPSLVIYSITASPIRQTHFRGKKSRQIAGQKRLPSPVACSRQLLGSPELFRVS